jgi:integrative and conjugative element protein (TIGR02256 family)
MGYVLVLPKRVYQAIERDCLGNMATEIGGVLQGRLIRNEFIVPFSLPAGPCSTKTPVHFSPDTAWQQVLLDFLHTRFGVDYVGDWHRHPGSFDRPSGHDLRTARQIVSTWKCSMALFPIAVVDGAGVRLRAFLMRRETLWFEEVPLEVVADNDPRVIAVLTGNHVEGGQRAQANSSRRESGSHREGGIFRRAAARLRALSPWRRTHPDSQRQA